MHRHRQQTLRGSLTNDEIANIDEMLHIGHSEADDDAIARMLSIWTTLPEDDRKLLCIYAELRSYRKMAAWLGASATTWRREINRIRCKFYERKKPR